MSCLDDVRIIVGSNAPGGFSIGLGNWTCGAINQQLQSVRLREVPSMRFPIGLLGVSQHKRVTEGVTLPNPVYVINLAVSKNVVVDSPELSRA